MSEHENESKFEGSDTDRIFIEKGWEVSAQEPTAQDPAFDWHPSDLKKGQRYTVVYVNQKYYYGRGDHTPPDGVERVDWRRLYELQEDGKWELMYEQED